MSGPTGWPFFGPLAYFTMGPSCRATRLRSAVIARSPVGSPRRGSVVRGGRRARLEILVGRERLSDEPRADRIALRIGEQTALGFVVEHRLSDAQQDQRIQHRAEQHE